MIELPTHSPFLGLHCVDDVGHRITCTSSNLTYWIWWSWCHLLYINRINLRLHDHRTCAWSAKRYSAFCVYLRYYIPFSIFSNTFSASTSPPEVFLCPRQYLQSNLVYCCLKCINSTFHIKIVNNWSPSANPCGSLTLESAKQKINPHIIIGN